MTNKNFSNKKINNNGFNFVDLGLPSGTLWASCNVGASKPSDSGFYFQWGDVQGYKAEQVGEGEGKKAFTWTDYKFNIDGDASKFSKYTTPEEALELEDDAANANMGGSWHMPTPKQIEELIDNTTSTWTTQDGVNGRLFISKKNGKSIFIPAAGFASGGSLNLVGLEADVWSFTLDTYDVYFGRYLYFVSGNIYFFNGYRYCGFSVRGVIG